MGGALSDCSTTQVHYSSNISHARHKLHLEHVCIGISQHQTTTGTRTHVPLALTCFHDDIGVCVLSAARPRDLGNGLDHIVKETHDSA
jgi:hypothetical protein